jgi:hypothetical protein
MPALITVTTATLDVVPTSNHHRGCLSRHFSVTRVGYVCEGCGVFLPAPQRAPAPQVPPRIL